jgi:hypothetical protein
MKHVLVFKTNLSLAEHIDEITHPLNALQFVTKWNVDMDDCDKVLRIESEKNNPQEIIQLIVQTGFHCEELV